MPTFVDLIQQSTAHAWLFIPSAILLGALHGLEPGHSKTMMAAFVIAIRGTVRQAVLLGLCATLSHTAVVWVIALGGLYLWRGLAPETIEPYLQLASGVIVICMAAWMLWRTRREQLLADAHDHHHDQEHHDHHHAHDDAHRIDTGHGVLFLAIVEDGVPPRFQLTAQRGLHWTADAAFIETERPDGARQTFAFRSTAAGALESVEEIPEPHEFMARLSLRDGDHSHSYDVAFIELAHGDDPVHAELRGLEAAGGYQDAHELAHANDIRRRFAGRDVTTAQIAVFGLTGGLIPCPGAITVLLLCLQLKAFTLGAVLVLCFSIGLALTMVSSGVIAALSVRQVSKRFSGFGEIVRKAPYASGALILLIGLYLGYSGWAHLPGR
ncbi:MAG: nickel/cobalt efflux transporter RcnA [Phenylobacterium sp.]|uniref:nickel/cobalt efflux transporter n=1 Tax=Phenylobacterium sp. TaxID=1871053 RepID=UPI001A5A6814|nr:nickel/cobalt efflux transporter [Phenylobacterium sp.]MBL8772237.1 nickel/cobalt efflux transporter RcnA [Phenylobacterium sp.]